MLIVNLILIMTGVLMGYTVYHQILYYNGKNVVPYEDYEFPQLEDGLIYVLPSDFCSKTEKFKGNLYLTGLRAARTDLKLLTADYVKLTDEVHLNFDQGTSVEVKGISTIGLGDEQFIFFGFEHLRFISKEEAFELYWYESHLELIRNAEKYLVRIPDGAPTFVFDWSERD